MVEPADPFQSDEFHRFEAPPWPAPMDDLGLVETVDRFGEGVVVAVAVAVALYDCHLRTHDQAERQHLEKFRSHKVSLRGDGTDQLNTRFNGRT